MTHLRETHKTLDATRITLWSLYLEASLEQDLRKMKIYEDAIELVVDEMIAIELDENWLKEEE